VRIAVVVGLATGCRSVFGFEDPVRVADAPPIDNAIDGKVDAAVDSPIDAASFNCSSSYAIITGGQVGHRYRFVNTPKEWVAMHDSECVATNGYLAIPNDAGELTAIATLAGGGTSWLGVSDRLTEGVFDDVLGNPYAALPLSNNGPGRDCVATKDSTSLEIENCGNNHPAVCECEE
jgi:hypothetical protein